MGLYDFFRNGFSLKAIADTLKFKRDFRKAHPYYFDPDGILVFCGPQGSGKTLSAVSYVSKLVKRYPKCIVVTNMWLNPKVFPQDRVFLYEDLHDLNKYENGECGVIFLLDEIQIEFNSLESKNIDPVVITEIAQQRKQRKHIVGTSQVFNRIAKPFREQFKYAVMCKNWGGLLQYNQLVKGEECTVDETGVVKTAHVKRFFWTHSPRLYKTYDTYAKIIRTNENDFYGKRVV